MAIKITGVAPNSPAWDAGVRSGDELVAIDGTEIRDYLDYMYLSYGEEVTLMLSDRTVSVENDAYMPLGLSFETLLMDSPMSCRNRCVFCFIDQLPPNMRETCYFKDDDYRLSFLQGNYITMTNMTDADVDRVIQYHLPRINISVHTTNPDLRIKMLHNKNAGEVLQYLNRFAEGGIPMNTQIVLCPGYNDGAELDKTIADLTALGDSMESISVVPVGLTAYRDGLEHLRAFDSASAADVIKQVEAWQEKCLNRWDSRKVYLADEFYIMAGIPLPDAEAYEDFPQLENGVGLCASLQYEFAQALKQMDEPKICRKKSIACGEIAAPFLQELCDSVPGEHITVYPIENRFFGESVTVTGLVCGGDLITQLQGVQLGEELLISSSMLRHGDTVFLDDVTVEMAEKELNIPITVVSNDGFELLEALIK